MNAPPIARRRVRGFTLVELLVVIVIIGMLMALLLPAIQSAKQSAQKGYCMNNAREIGLAHQSYVTKKGRFVGYRNSIAGSPVAYGWVAELLPELGRNDLHNQIRANPRNLPKDIKIEILLCPSDAFKQQEPLSLSYVVNCGVVDDVPSGANPLDTRDNAVFLENFLPGKQRVKQTLEFISSHDGAATTLMLSENVAAKGWPIGSEATFGLLFPVDDPPNIASYPQWKVNGFAPGGTEIALASTSTPFSVARPSSYHPGGANVIYAGGNAGFLSESVDFTVYCLLMTPYGAGATNPATGTHLVYQNAILNEADLE